ncbi:hypothetical protein R1sor_005419 [Riccia sorocarpa]|uniref:Uncharacterized protein n=1 Tax=Riccia sorocarpa TaxID=122646 RepID=A0ABD3HK39_9MARC
MTAKQHGPECSISNLDNVRHRVGELFDRAVNKWKLLQDGELGRTKGIEVDWLEWENGKKVSIRDLGGQDIFRALQELLFPKISKVCAFIFFCVGSLRRGCGKLRSRFEGVVDLSPDNEICYVNGKKEADVKPVMNSVLQWMDHLLENRTPRVPSICSNLILQLAKRCPDVLVYPIQKASSFYKYCCGTVVSLEKFNPADDQGRQVLHAVASFLHDAGSIIMVPSVSAGREDLVAVDPNWLTRSFLGELIGQGHGFWSQKEKLWSLPAVQQDGRASKAEKQPGDVNGHVLSWNPSSSVTEDSGHTFFGFRMQCHDRERTCLSSVLYPRFQIHLRQALLKSLGEHHHTFRFARDYLQVEANGHEIIVENDGMEGDHVDFLARGSIHKSREEAKQFVRKHFMDEFLSFCASSKGCRGVQLVVAIVRPDIVRELVPHKFRGKALPVVELKQRVLNYAMERLQEGGDEHVVFNFEYQWPSIPEARWPSRSELAKDLLQEKDIQEVMVVIHKEHLQHGLKLQKLHFTKAPDDPNSKESVEVFDDTLAELDEYQRLEVVMKRELSQVKHLFNDRFEQLRVELRNFRHILEAIRSTMSTVMSQIDRMFSYTKSRQKHQIPCRSYFTVEDVSTAQRVNAFMHGGKAMCLHFMCESKQGYHLVENQPGVVLQVEKAGSINKCLR